MCLQRLRDRLRLSRKGVRKGRLLPALSCSRPSAPRAGSRLPAASALPDELDPIAVQLAVGADQGKTLDLGLCDQKAVERIAVVHRQRSHPIGMSGGDRQEVDAGPFQLLKQVRRSFELAEAALDRDLPDDDRTDHNPVAFGGDRLPCPLADLVRVPGHPPEDDVSVEQEVQGCMPRDSARSSGSSSKSSAIFTFPRQAPAREEKPSPCRSGTSRAAGSPRRVMTISSPACARSTNFDSWVLASCIPMRITEETIPAS